MSDGIGEQEGSLLNRAIRLLVARPGLVESGLSIM